MVSQFNFFQVCFYAFGLLTALPIKVILHDKNRNKNELCHFGTILFLFCCSSSVLFNTSVVMKINIFSFRLNGLKSNYFCGELSHVSVLLAILCLSDFTTSVIIQLLLLRANISRGNIRNQHYITSFVIMRNLFSFRLNGRKATIFVVSHLTFPYCWLFCVCLFYHKRYYTVFIAAC